LGRALSRSWSLLGYDSSVIKLPISAPRVETLDAVRAEILKIRSAIVWTWEAHQPTSVPSSIPTGKPKRADTLYQRGVTGSDRDRVRFTLPGIDTRRLGVR
jgi:hypothetical protein